MQRRNQATQPADKLKENGWEIFHNYHTPQSIKGFLDKKNENRGIRYSYDESPYIGFRRIDRKDQKISSILLFSSHETHKKESFTIEILNTANNETRESFEKFGEALNWKKAEMVGGPEQQKVCGFSSPKIHHPEQAKNIIQAINQYDTLPSIVKFQLGVASGFSAISKDELVLTYSTYGYDEAFKFLQSINDCPLHDELLIALADACYKKADFAHASHAYSLVSKDSEFYKKAQCHLGNMLIVDVERYPSKREYYKARLSYYIAGYGYEHSVKSCNTIFNSLCNPEPYASETEVPFPKGATHESVIKIADHIYEMARREKKLEAENARLRENQLAEKGKSSSVNTSSNMFKSEKKKEREKLASSDHDHSEVKRPGHRSSQSL